MSNPDPLVAPVVGRTPEDVCLRCGRVPSDLIHDNPNDHGWTGTSAMHPFVDERGKWLLQWAARNVSLHGKSSQKGSRLTDDQVKWNEAIGKAESAVAEMFAPLTSESLARHDRYFADEYVKRAALVPRPEPREPESLPDIELVAAAVHEAWMIQKRAKGITSAPSQQTGEEQLRPYAELSNEVQEYDRATVRAVYDAIQFARRRDADEERDANALGQKRAIWRHPADAAVRPASAPSLEPRFPKGHPALCYELCDPTFEVTPHIHTSMGVYIVEVEP